LKPNGRFEVGKKICLTISAHHPESWQPSWSVRTALVALIGFFPTEGQGAIGALDYPDKERIKLARASLAWSCDKCHSHNATALPPRPDDTAAADASDLVKQSGIDVSEIKISKIVNIDEPDPASLPAPPREPASALVPPVQNEPNVIPERPVQQHQQIQQPQEQMQEQQQQQQQQSHGGAISATQLFVYLLVTCIVALILRKFLMAQGAPRVPIA
jgi:ubiquitin-conjugating enzyme E2 J1